MQTATPAPVPVTVWAVRGRHTGPAPADELRVNLQQLRDDAVVDDFLELKDEPAFEARWRVDGEVTVRARLSLEQPGRSARTGTRWVLVAEAEQPWQPGWPSPAGRFWPLAQDAEWDHDVVPGVRFRHVNRLPEDDKEMRRRLRDCARDSWAVHVVVHEAMTPDDRGRRPLAELLPPSLRHRVVEHRAAPHQFRAVNWALKDLEVEVPRGGAALLPPFPEGRAQADFVVRDVFLDGTPPVDLVDALVRFTAKPRMLPGGASKALTALREGWQLTTLEEELERQRELVTMYREALEAMTKSRDLYKEAAERAHEALAAYREAGVEPLPEPEDRPVPSALRNLTRTFERLKPRRPAD